MSKPQPPGLRTRIARALAVTAARIGGAEVVRQAAGLHGVDDSRGWWSLLSSRGWHQDFQTGDIEVRHDNVLAQATVFACQTLIAGDGGKLRIKLVERETSGIWSEVESASFSPVLRKPNRFQTRQQFLESWIHSKLSRGNAYILKEREARGVVVAMYVLDPMRCRPLVSTLDGSVYYALGEDDLSRVFEARDGVDAIPASEIIHDRWNCLFHPLVGISPLFACGLAATHGLQIQKHSAKFFANSGRPSGILTAPGEISDETAQRAKEYFEAKFSGDNVGRIAVLADGLKYEAMTARADESQLVEQLKLSAEQVAATFHVPAYMVGAAPVPPNNNVQALNLQYYSQCLQKLIEAIEACLDEGLGLTKVQGKTLGTELDLDGLLRMDTVSLTASLKEQVLSGITSPNEARARLNLPPVAGGESPLAQQQNFSLAALAKRDALPNPFDPGSGGKQPGAKSWVTKAPGSSTSGADDEMDRQELQELIIKEVAKAMATLPAPKVDEEMANTLVGKHVELRLGSVVEKIVDGRVESIATKAAMLVPAGRDGQPGRDGRTGERGEDGTNGRDGANGRDGFTPDDLEVVVINDRTLEFVVRAGDRRIARRVSLQGLPIYRGTLKSGAKGFKVGDLYTYGSSLWVVKRDTDTLPPGDDWQLCVRAK